MYSIEVENGRFIFFKINRRSFDTHMFILPFNKQNEFDPSMLRSLEFSFLNSQEFIGAINKEILSK